MKKLTIVASAAALLAASSLSALAAEATGMITSIDTAAGTVTLDNGQTFVLPPSVDAVTLEAGQQVTIIYEESADGALNASEITAGPI